MELAMDVMPDFAFPGKDVILRCAVDEEPKTPIRWERIGRPLPRTAYVSRVDLLEALEPLEDPLSISDHRKPAEIAQSASRRCWTLSMQRDDPRWNHVRGDGVEDWREAVGQLHSSLL